jgi:protein-L-isoaspartate(D-aspartate) O-methyltransferase
MDHDPLRENAAAEGPVQEIPAEETPDLPLNDREAYVSWMLEHTQEEEHFIRWRWQCARDLVNWSSIQDERVLEAFLRTPREIFIREHNRSRAYEHSYMPIGYGSTITDPWVVSIMTQAANPAKDDRVLEIGTGSGYQSALLSHLTDHVFTVEVIGALAKETDRLLNSLQNRYPEYSHIKRKSTDGYYGWAEHAPYQSILVTCSIDHIPPLLLRQLHPGGSLIIPVGPPSGQTLMKITKAVSTDGEISYERESIMPVKFIPFKNRKGESYSNQLR